MSSEEKATEFLLSQTREALDNALKKSLREREVLMTSRKVRSLSSTKLKKKKISRTDLANVNAET